MECRGNLGSLQADEQALGCTRQRLSLTGRGLKPRASCPRHEAMARGGSCLPPAVRSVRTLHPHMPGGAAGGLRQFCSPPSAAPHPAVAPASPGRGRIGEPCGSHITHRARGLLELLESFSSPRRLVSRLLALCPSTCLPQRPAAAAPLAAAAAPGSRRVEHSALPCPVQGLHAPLSCPDASCTLDTDPVHIGMVFKLLHGGQRRV